MKDIRLLEADEIECRVGTCSNKGLSLLLYKDARCDMKILDEVFGPMNWQCEYSRDNANCTVKVWDEDKAQWISKEDTGVESNTEKEKGLASDSFKRACFKWGIGRELYTAPFIWIWPTDCEIKKNDRGKWACYDKFSVKSIGFNENRQIVGLTITNSDKDGKVVFDMQKPVERPEKEEPEPVDPPQDPTPTLKEIRHELMIYCNEHQLDLGQVWEQYGIRKDTPVDIFQAKFDMIRRDYGE